ncbi:DUF2914 domain-containing protein [Rheinheimera sp.]|uniref:DUF2914 domain-containing protein n=1 Tax=Rheinheimera sp. TaxID=1869214 RepID=UPI00307DBF57
MSEGKVVVRLQLRAQAGSSQPGIQAAPEYQWLWHRILGAAVLVLLPFWWLWPDAADSTDVPVATSALAAQPAQTHNRDAVGATGPQHISLELSAASRLKGPEPAEMKASQPAPPQITPAPAFQTAPAVAPLFSAAQGVLRKVVLTADKPGPAARQLSLPVRLEHATELFLYTEVVGLAGQQIEHRWYYKNKLMTTVALPVKLPYWRTWSKKKFYPAELRDWRLEIVGPKQKLLFSYSLNG